MAENKILEGLPERPPAVNLAIDSGAIGDPKVRMQLRQIHSLESAIRSRADLAEKLGYSYGGDRDLYSALGYEKAPNFRTYYAKYRRHGISKTIVKAPVEASWRRKPTISDSTDKNQTEFEKKWLEIVEKHRVWHFLSRADRLTGIGQYGVLYLGFNDSSDPSSPIGEQAELVFMRPYMEGNAEITKFVTDVRNPRYGLPDQYTLSMKNEFETSQLPKKTVHWSRVIHIAEDLDSDDVYGTPRLEAPLNDVVDLEKVVGGSAEMFWRGAFPGIALTAQADAAMDTMDLDDLEDELQAYIHKLQRYIRLQGIELKELAPQVVDPNNHFNVLIQSISACTRIPKRILIGSERGELASSQDEINWGNHITTRRSEFIEPVILRPFIDILIKVGMLPEPVNNRYSIIWPDVTVPTVKEQAEVNRIYADTLNKYVTAPGASTVVPERMFLKKFMGFTDEDVDQAEEILGHEVEVEMFDAKMMARYSQKTDVSFDGESYHGDDETKVKP